MNDGELKWQAEAVDLAMGGVYVHIPFCVRKCAYCDFVSYQAPDIASLAPAYLDAVLAELRLRQGELNRIAPIGTVYIGGGTPTCVPWPLLASFIQQLLQAIFRVDSVTTANRAQSRLAATAAGPAVSEIFGTCLTEVTVEANPGTVSREGLAALREAGANRLSLGFQSLIPSELTALGRIHSAADCLNAFAHARAAGFDNLSVDLILGAPGQTFTSLEHTTDIVVDLDPEHVSAYCLSLEPGTPLAARVESGAASVPDDDHVADLYELFVTGMAASGRARYEISNFARPGFESRHNMGYWRNGQYIGLGVAAHSHTRVDAQNTAPVCGTSVSRPNMAPSAGARSWNTSSVEAYIDSIRRGRLPMAGREARTPGEEARDALMLGLRMSDGVDLDALSHEYGVDLVGQYTERFHRLAERGLVEVSGRASCSRTHPGPALGLRVRLAPHAFLVANQVFMECV